MVDTIENAKIYTDFNGLNAIKRQAKSQDPAALMEVAQQFEALFLQQVLKAMRDANETFSSGLWDSNQTKTYESMFDQQLSLSLSEKGTVGLSQVLASQIDKEYLLRTKGKKSVVDEQVNFKSHSLENFMNPIVSGVKKSGEMVDKAMTPVNFVKQVWPHVLSVASELSMDPKVFLAQAALETGWGKSLINHGDGKSSFNLFNIKADKVWSGDKVSVNTLEYKEGIPVKEKASFRSYASFEESVADYVNFLKENPRYKEALEKTSNPKAFTDALQEAGYATDPKYSKKIQELLHGSQMKEALKAALQQN